MRIPAGRQLVTELRDRLASFAVSINTAIEPAVKRSTRTSGRFKRPPYRFSVIGETLETWSVMETIISIVGLVGVLVLRAFV